MKEFKKLFSYYEALDILLSRPISPKEEMIGIRESRGRVLASDVRSPVDSPPFDRAAMDGYAIVAEDTFCVGESSPAVLEVTDDITAGQVSGRTVTNGKAIGVMTGTKLPQGANAVVMQEFTRRDGNSLEVTQRLPPQKNVSMRGEDISKGDMVSSAGTLVSSRHISLMGSLGIESVKVFKRPAASIIVTGDEFTSEDGEYGADGKIFESNSLMLSSLLEEIGCSVSSVQIVPDEVGMISRSIDVSGPSDFVLLTGGSSFGAKDMAHKIFPKFLFHGVTIKPGRPFGLSERNGKPCFVMSGYPVAAFAQFYLFVVPYIEAALGTSLLKKAILPISTDLSSSLGRMEFVRCRLEGGIVEPVMRSGSGVLSSLVQADGYILVDELTEGLNRGEMVEFTYFF